MTNPVSSTSSREVQVAHERKKVSWGENEVVFFKPLNPIPEGCSEQVEELARQFLTCRVDLIEALTHPRDFPKRDKVIKSLRQIINTSSNETSPLSRKINSISHIFLARALFGVLSSNYLEEIGIINKDP